MAPGDRMVLDCPPNARCDDGWCNCPVPVTVRHIHRLTSPTLQFVTVEVANGAEAKVPAKWLKKARR